MSTKSCLDLMNTLKKKSIKIWDIVWSKNNFYVLVSQNNIQQSQTLKDVLTIQSIWLWQSELCDENVLNFFEAVVNVICCSTSDMIWIYHKVIKDMSHKEEIEKYININQNALLKYFSHLKKDMSSVLKWLRTMNEDVVWIVQNFSESQVKSDDNLEMTLKRIKNNTLKIYHDRLSWASENSDLCQEILNKLIRKLEHIHASSWSLVELFDVIKRLVDQKNVFEYLLHQKKKLWRDMNQCL